MPSLKHGILFCIACFLPFHDTLHAKVYSPKVLTQHAADLSGNWDNFKHFPLFQGKTDQALAEAVFSYLTDTITGFYHSFDVRAEYSGWENTTIRAGQEAAGNYGDRIEFWLARDPVLAYNVHGYGLCFHNSQCFNGVMNALGFPVRTGTMRTYHKFSEIFFNGSWHYIDADQRGYVKLSSGVIPSWLMLAQHSNFFDSNSFAITPYFPFPANAQGPGMLSLSTIKAFADSTRLNSSFHEQSVSNHVLCHTMDYVLRKGESIRRYWRSDSGRFYCAIEQWDRNAATAGAYWSGVATQYWPNFNRDPFGPKSWETGLSGSANTTGFGIITYKPDLTGLCADYTDGVYADSNVVQRNQGIMLSANGSGYVIFKTYTPYVIIAKANDVQTRTDDTEGALLKYTTAGNTEVFISKDNGASWYSIETGSDLDAQKDLSVQIYGRYGYLVKFVFTGSADAAGLAAFETQTMVSVAPMSLPYLKEGSNVMTYTTSDVRGFKTTPVNLHIDISDSAAANRTIVSNTMAAYNPYVLLKKMQNGDVVLKAAGPAGSKMKWCSIGSFMYVGWNQAYDYTFGVSKTASNFTDVAVYQPIAGNHWNATMNKTVDLSDYSDELYVRYHTSGSGGYDRLFLYAHYEDSVMIPEDQVRVTYCFDQDGLERTFSFDADSGATHTEVLSGVIQNRWVEIAVPSSGASGIVTGGKKNNPDLMTVAVFPNPFNPAVTISIRTNKETPMHVALYTVSGRCVADLTPYMAHGTVTWDASAAPAGVYYIKVRTRQGMHTRAIALVR